MVVLLSSTITSHQWLSKYIHNISCGLWIVKPNTSLFPNLMSLAYDTVIKFLCILINQSTFISLHVHTLSQNGARDYKQC